MIKNEFRKLNDFESKLLSKLLENPFPGRDEIRDQIKNCRVKMLDIGVDNYGSIEFETDSKSFAQVKQRAPVEARAFENNVPIDVLIHVVDGKIKELEIVKLDGSPIEKIPSPSEFKVTIRE
mgnify:CR=1 FL=1